MVIQGITTPTSAVYWTLGVKVIVDERGCNCTVCDGHDCTHVQQVRARLMGDAHKEDGRFYSRKRKGGSSADIS